MHNSALKELLDSYRLAAATEREKGKYFEGLILCYLRNEAAYRDLYSDVWTYGEWATSNKGWIAVIPASIWWQKTNTDACRTVCKLYAAHRVEVPTKIAI